MKKFKQFLNENTQEEKWAIFAGLGGGFGGGQLLNIFDGNQDDANQEAWQLSVQEYEQMEGLHGLRDLEEIMEEDEVDEIEAEDIRQEEMEIWLDYWVEPYDSEKHII